MSLQRAIRPKTFYSAILLIILTLAITITNRIATTENAALPAPGGVDTSLQLWLKADAGVYNDAGSTLAADTETVQQWHDQSGNSRHALQDTADQRPMLKSNEINFNPTLHNATDTFLRIDEMNVTASADGGLLYIVHQDIQDAACCAGSISTMEQTGRGNVKSGNIHLRIDNQVATYFTQGGIRGNKIIIGDLPITGTHIIAFGQTAPNTIELIANGTSIGADTSTKDPVFSDINIFRGWRNDSTQRSMPATGNVAEIIIYDGVVSAAQRTRIDSYLALKYGVTLGSDYVDSADSILWDSTTNATYHNDVAGIARDDNSGLNQPKSQSINDDALVTIDSGTLTTDLSTLIWGNNDGSTTLDVTSGSFTHMGRIWKVSESGSIGSVTVSIPNSTGAITLLIDDDGDFSTGATATTLTTSGSDLIANVDFSNGQYFTLSSSSAPPPSSAPAPGGIDTNLQLWLKADAGTNTTTDGATTTQWEDQVNSNVLTNAGNPTYAIDAINFNPAIDFDGNSHLLTTAPSGLSGLEGAPARTFFVIASRRTGGSELLYIGRNNTGRIGGQQSLSIHNGSSLFRTVYRTSNSAGRNGDLRGNTVTDTQQPYLFGFSSPAGADMVGGSLFVDGATQVTTVSNNDTIDIDIRRVMVGAGIENDGSFKDPVNGHIAEVIAYNAELGAATRRQVETYLALKYGITLNNISYVNSAGATVWDAAANASYHFDVAGIGRDDNSALNQKQSKSVNTDGLVAMGLGNMIAADNASNTNTFAADKTFLMWGNNDGATTFTTAFTGPSSTNIHMPRIWKVQETGDAGSVRVAIPNSTTFTNAASRYLLVSSDATFDASDTAYALTDDGSTYLYADVDLADGDYFTFASASLTPSAAPGGVGADLGLWMKADAGATIVGSRVHQWDDAFNNGHSFVRDIATGGPGYIDGANSTAFNFNPSLDFDGSSTRLADYDMGGLGTTDDQTILAIVRYDGDAQYFFSLRSADNLITDMSIYNVKLHSLNNSVPYEPLANDIPLNATTIMVGGRDGNAGNDGEMTGIFNGNAVSTTDLFNNSDNNFNTDVAKIGTYGPGFHYKGSLSEIVMFERELTDAELTQVMSYLAIKYGITLNGSNYVNSAGTVIWDSTANATYHNDVVGIARDDDGTLNQKQSKSDSSDALVTIGAGNLITTTNQAHTATLTSPTALLWGNDDGGLNFSTTFTGPLSTTIRMGRMWYVQETGETGSVRVAIPRTTVPSYVTPYLIVSNDTTFDTNDMAYLLTDDGVNYLYADLNLSDGDYFTFGVNASANSCSVTNPVLTVCSVTTSRQPFSDPGYTLDGARMNDSRAKLLNAANFGLNGTVEAEINIIDAFGTANSITPLSLSQCDAFFLGTFSDSAASFTDFTTSELTALQDWSNAGGLGILSCSANGQAACNHFGFNTANQRSNPTTPVDLTHPFFQGPFGSVSTFNQGGASQGYFNSPPASATVLAQNNAGNPTVLIDAVSQDIFLADVDYFTDLGNISNGGGITSDVDIFWGNLFADVISNSCGIVTNQPPVAVADSYTATEDTTLSIVVGDGILTNDTDVDNDPLTAVVATNPNNGILTLNSNGSFSYAPSLNFNGADSFTYVANDGILDSNIVTVTITVNPVNDVPVAVGDSYTIAEDNVLTVPIATGVLNNDSDVDFDTLTVVLDNDVSNGTLTLNANGSFSYTPTLHFNGSDSFTYHANDGTVDSATVTVNLTITPVNDLPVANAEAYTTTEDVALTIPIATGVLTNDTDIENSPLTAVLGTNVSNGTLVLNANGSFNYTPDFNFDGVDSFTYFANDGTIDSALAATVVITVAADTDGDLVPDTIDIDDDGDGITDILEGEPSARNSDDDALPDHLDIDSDNDGLPDIVEAQTTLGYQLPLGTDDDGDGWDDRWDSDSGGTAPPIVNTDVLSDTIPDYLDSDTDNDALPDLFENGMNVGLRYVDTDADGLDDAFEGVNLLDDNRPNDEFLNPSVDIPDFDKDVFSPGGDVDYRDKSPDPNDTDGDNIPNEADLDDDNDGILDVDEGLGLRGLAVTDRDRDGVPNYLDLDSDNNGMPDVVENQMPDANLDGVHDGWDEANPDENQNGWLDSLEANPQAPHNSDNDRVPNFIDPDNRNYGVLDSVAYNFPDSDSDGIHDGWLNFNPDANLNGWLDSLEGNSGRVTLPLALDPDQDGVLTAVDGDYDADGIPDVIEIGFPDANNDHIHDGWDAPNPDANNNGALDILEPAMGGTPFTPRNSDGDGQPDFRDIDDDGDGIPTNIEAQSLAGYLPPTGEDADGDGIDNQYDSDFVGGVPLPTEDTDGDGEPNYLDLDSNANYLTDNFYNGMSETPNGSDADNDGLDDAYEHGSLDDGYVSNDEIADPAAIFGDLYDTNLVAPDDDGDSIPNQLELIGDRDGDGIADRDDFEPTGYFYEETTGRIIPGGSIAVSGGNVTIHHNGIEGFYHFTTDQKAGLYTIIVTPPRGFALSNDCAVQPTIDPVQDTKVHVVGAPRLGDVRMISDTTCAANPYYLTLQLQPDDPFLINNNIPLRSTTDYGDLPATYGATLFFDNGARHDEGLLYLGAGVDAEPDGQISADSSADSSDNGITIANNDPWLIGTQRNLNVTVTGGSGHLVGWFDWNRNNEFDVLTETVDFGVLAAGEQTVSVTIHNVFDTFSDELLVTRFRLFPVTRDGYAHLANPLYGYAADGEVEDYVWDVPRLRYYLPIIVK